MSEILERSEIIEREESMRVFDWLLVVSEEMREKRIPLTDRVCELNTDEARQLLIEMADSEAYNGRMREAKVLRRVLFDGDPATFLNESGLSLDGMLIQAKKH